MCTDEEREIIKDALLVLESGTSWDVRRLLEQEMDNPPTIKQITGVLRNSNNVELINKKEIHESENRELAKWKWNGITVDEILGD